jgi:GNAT superfamily N-acetyltransferase
VRIRPALPNDAGRLSELAFASKAEWGYDREFMERCRPELTFEPGQLAGLRAHLLEEEGEILGFFMVRGTPPEGELADLFVAPSAMARGIGTALLEAAGELAATAGFHTLHIHSDPFAEGFYLRNGAVRIGETPSGSIPGRLLPLLRLDLAAKKQCDKSCP